MRVGDVASKLAPGRALLDTAQPRFSSDTHVLDMNAALRACGSDGLTALALSHLQLSTDDLRCLLHGVRRPVAGPKPLLVDLSGNALDAAGVRVLAAHRELWRALRFLSLRDNPIADEGAVMLVNEFFSSSSHQLAFIEQLDLANCSLTDVAASALARGALRYCASVRWLDLSGNSVSDAGAEAIASAIMYTPRLECLVLSRNKIGDVGAGAIAAALQVPSVLRALYLNDNDIGGKGLVAIASSLASNTSLFCLDLSFCRGLLRGLGNDLREASKVLGTALAKNETLQWIALEGIRFGKALEPIGEALKTNAMLARITLSASINNLSLLVAGLLENNTVTYVTHESEDDSVPDDVMTYLLRNRERRDIFYSSVKDGTVSHCLPELQPGGMDLFHEDYLFIYHALLPSSALSSSGNNDALSSSAPVAAPANVAALLQQRWSWPCLGLRNAAGESVVFAAVQCGSFDVIGELASARVPTTALHVAALYGDVDDVVTLLDAQQKAALSLRQSQSRLANIAAALSSMADASGRTPLHFAVVSGNVRLCAALLDAGADPNKKMASGRTLLHLASEFGLSSVLKLLVERVDKKALINFASREDGLMPLHLAAMSGSAECCQILLQNGARTNVRCIQGDCATPLHYATNAPVVHALLDFGAYMGSGNAYVVSAASKGLVDVVAALLERGASKACLHNVVSLDLQHQYRHSLPLWIASCRQLSDPKLVEGNPLGTLPRDVYEKGDVAVVEFLKATLVNDNASGATTTSSSSATSSSSKVAWEKLRVFALGNEGVGKTHLLRAMMGEKYASHEPTDGITVDDFTLKSAKQPLSWLEFGGRRIFDSTHQLFLGGVGVFLIVFDMQDEHLMHTLQHWIRSVSLLESSRENPIVLLGTHLDAVTDARAAEVRKLVGPLVGVGKVVACQYVSCVKNVTQTVAAVSKSIVEASVCGGLSQRCQVSASTLQVLNWCVLQREQGRLYMFLDEVAVDFPSWGSKALKDAMSELHGVGEVFFHGGASFVCFSVPWLASIFAGLVTFPASLDGGGVVGTGTARCVVKVNDLERIWKLPLAEIIRSVAIFEWFHVAVPRRALGEWVVPALLQASRDNDASQLAPVKPARHLQERVFRFQVLPFSFFARVLAGLFEWTDVVVDLVTSSSVVVKKGASKSKSSLSAPMLGNTVTSPMTRAAPTPPEVLWISVNQVDGPDGSQEELRVRSSVRSVAFSGLMVRVSSLIQDVATSVFGRNGAQSVVEAFVVCPHCLDRSVGHGSVGGLSRTESNSELDLAAEDGTKHEQQRTLVPFAKCFELRLRGERQFQCDAGGFAKDSQSVLVKLLGDDLAVAHVHFFGADEISSDADNKYFVVNATSGSFDEVSVKALSSRLDSERLFQAFQREVVLMASVQHVNIVQLVGVSSSLELVVENCAGGDLLSALKSSVVPANSSGAIGRRIALDVARALEFLHSSCSPAVIHRDIRAANVFLTRLQDLTVDIDGIPLAKLGDFSFVITCAGQPVDSLPTWRWMAPEVLSGEPCSEASDMYSFGMLLWEIYCGRGVLPFDEFGGKGPLLDDVIERTLRPTLKRSVPPSIQSLVGDLWSADASQRSTASTCVQVLADLRDETSANDDQGESSNSTSPSVSPRGGVKTSPDDKNAQQQQPPAQRDSGAQRPSFGSIFRRPTLGSASSSPSSAASVSDQATSSSAPAPSSSETQTSLKKSPPSFGTLRRSLRSRTSDANEGEVTTTPLASASRSKSIGGDIPTPVAVAASPTASSKPRLQVGKGRSSDSTGNAGDSAASSPSATSSNSSTTAAASSSTSGTMRSKFRSFVRRESVSSTLTTSSETPLDVSSVAVSATAPASTTTTASAPSTPTKSSSGALPPMRLPSSPSPGSLAASSASRSAAMSPSSNPTFSSARLRAGVERLVRKMRAKNEPVSGDAEDQGATAVASPWELQFAQSGDFAYLLTNVLRQQICASFQRMDARRRDEWSALPLKTDTACGIYRSVMESLGIEDVAVVDRQLAIFRDQSTNDENHAFRRGEFTRIMRSALEQIAVDIRSMFDEKGIYDLWEGKAILCSELLKIADFHDGTGSSIESLPGEFVPRVLVSLCVRCFLSGGWKSPAIFRAVPTQAEREAVRKWMQDPAAPGGLDASVTAVAFGSALLDWFNALPQKLIPSVSAALNAGGDWSKARLVVEALEPTQRKCLVFICAFLRALLGYKSENGLTLQIVAERFAGALVDSRDPRCIDFICCLIEKLPVAPWGQIAIGYMVSIRDRERMFHVTGWDGVACEYICGKPRDRKGDVVRVKPEAIQSFGVFGAVLPDIPDFPLVVSAFLERTDFVVPIFLQPLYNGRGNARVFRHLFDGPPVDAGDGGGGAAGAGSKVSVALDLLRTVHLLSRGSVVSFARNLAAVALFEGAGLQFLKFVAKPLVEEELKATDNIGTLFRANTLASRSLSALFNVAGPQLLANTLREPIRTISLLQRQKDIASLVTVHANAIIDGILSSENDIPFVIRGCCSMIRDCVQERFPDKDDIWLLAVSGALFLRYYCPALLSPSEFGVLPEHSTLSPFGKELLVQITSVIQCLCNQVTIPKGKPLFALNETFLAVRRDDVNSFMKRICDSGSSSESSDDVSLMFSSFEPAAINLALALQFSMGDNAGSGPSSPRSPRGSEQGEARPSSPRAAKASVPVPRVAAGVAEPVFKQLCTEESAFNDTANSFVFEVLEPVKKPVPYVLTVRPKDGSLTIETARGQKSSTSRPLLSVLVQRSRKDDKRVTIKWNDGRQKFIFANAFEREKFLEASWAYRKEMPKKSLYSQALDVQVCTWNLGSAIPPAHLDNWIFPGRSDVYAICVQEANYGLPSGQGGTAESHLFALLMTTLGSDYFCVEQLSLLHLRLAVYARKSLQPRVRRVKKATVAAGIGNMIGNKGACAVAFYLNEESFCFIGAHLASAEEGKGQKSETVYHVLRELSLHQSAVAGAGIETFYDHVFFAGDLNFRINSARPDVLRLCGAGDVDSLLKLDSLSVARKQNTVFSAPDWKEPAIRFLPTYRYQRGSAAFSDEKMRTPSYCDRVLYRSNSCGVGPVSEIEYAACFELTTSDHRPVWARFAVPTIMPMFLHDRPPFGVIELTNLMTSDLTDFLVSKGVADGPFLLFHSPFIKNEQTARSHSMYSPAWTEKMSLKSYRCHEAALRVMHISVVISDGKTAFGECVIPLQDAFSKTPVGFAVPIWKYTRRVGELRGDVQAKLVLKL